MVGNKNDLNNNTKENKFKFNGHEQGAKLFLFNDDVNTFDFVIDNLVEFCDIGIEQAEQLALLVHFKGKIIIKQGQLTFLNNICKNLLDAGLTSEVNY